MHINDCAWSALSKRNNTRRERDSERRRERKREKVLGRRTTLVYARKDRVFGSPTYNSRGFLRKSIGTRAYARGHLFLRRCHYCRGLNMHVGESDVLWQHATRVPAATARPPRRRDIVLPTATLPLTLSATNLFPESRSFVRAHAKLFISCHVNKETRCAT